MVEFEENGYDETGEVESSASGIIGLVANLAEAEAAAKAAKAEYERLSVLQDELHEPEKWCPKKAGELHGLLVRRAAQLKEILKEHPERMESSGRMSRGDLGAHIEYDLGYVERQKAMLALALQHGHKHPETDRARQAVQAHVNHWMSRRGR